MEKLVYSQFAMLMALPFMLFLSCNVSQDKIQIKTEPTEFPKNMQGRKFIVTKGKEAVELLSMHPLDTLIDTLFDEKYCLVMFKHDRSYYLAGGQKTTKGWVQDYYPMEPMPYPMLASGIFSTEITMAKIIDGETLFVEEAYSGSSFPKDVQEIIDNNEEGPSKNRVRSIYRLSKKGVEKYQFRPPAPINFNPGLDSISIRPVH